MSNPLAIASVSYVLKDLLNDNLINHDVSGTVGGNVSVTVLPPDRIDTTITNANSQLNLFMYRVTINESWSNMGYPSRNSNGERINNPPLALDLHYLLTAYGAEELHAEILLGYGMQILHETPILNRDDIRKSLTPSPSLAGGGLPPELLALSTSELAEQIEQIKITPLSQSTEELSKIWSIFESKYRPTSAYIASVVLIQSKKSTKQSLPVLKQLIYVIPFRQPVIEKILSQTADDEEIVEKQKILEGYNLVIVGKQLRGDTVLLNIDGNEVLPDQKNITDNQIICALPSGLKSGIQGVQVIHRQSMGSPAELHRGVESNVAAFVLSPEIISVNVSNINGTGSDPRSADIELEIVPEVQKTQKVVMLLNEVSTGTETEQLKSYSFQAVPLTLSNPPGPSDKITISISGVKSGNYLVRIQVDGAESPLSIDSSGKYFEPQVTIL